MKEYVVTMDCKSPKKVNVKANSKEEACKKAREEYPECDIEKCEEYFKG